MSVIKNGYHSNGVSSNGGVSSNKSIETDSALLTKPSPVGIAKNQKQQQRIPVSLPQWARVVQLASWFGLFSYMIYTQQNLNFFIFCGRINQIIVLPLITLREGGTHLTSLEYNIQSRCLMGILAYMVALFVLSLQTNPIASLINGKTKEFVALAFVCGFKSIDKLFSYCYCESIPRYSTLEVIEENLAFPIKLGLLYFFEYGPIDPKYTVMLASYFLLKLIHTISEYQTISAVKTETVPKQTPITATIADSVKAEDAKTKVDPKKDVWRIYGNLYDMTDYVAHHPGGKEAIMLGANRDDCTTIFASYHAFNIQKAKTVLEKYRISDLTPGGYTKEMLLSDTHINDPFYDVLARRVGQTLRDHGLDPVKDRAGTWSRWACYGTVLIGVFVGAYLHCAGSMLGGLMFGFFGAHMGAMIGHDGGHFAVSRIPFINDLAVWGTSMISNPIIWQHQHTFAHHTYTNEEEHDPDLHHFHVFMRVSNKVPLIDGYKRQSSPWYVLMVWLLTNIGTCYWYALRFVFERSLHGAVDWSDRKRVIRSLGVIFHIAAYSVVCMIAPFFSYEYSWSAFVAALIPIMVCGFYFALASQVGHLTEFTMKRDPIEAQARRSTIAKTSWAADQIETTNDYAPQSTFWFLVGGGLGLQVEHHLFPSLNHCHLTKIQPIVKQTAQEYNVHYNVFDSYPDVFAETLKYLTALSDVQPEEITKAKKL